MIGHKTLETYQFIIVMFLFNHDWNTQDHTDVLFTTIETHKA